MALPQDFFTSESIATFGGASLAVWVLSNVIRIITGRDTIKISLIVAIVVAFIGAYGSHKLDDVIAYFLALLNGCLLFLTAAGTQTVAHKASEGDLGNKASLHGSEPVKFLTPWFK